MGLSCARGTTSCTCAAARHGDVCPHTHFILRQVLGLPPDMIDDLFEYGGFDDDAEVDAFGRAVRDGLSGVLASSDRRCYACRSYLRGLSTVRLRDGRAFHPECYAEVKPHLE